MPVDSWALHGRSLRDWFDGDTAATIVIHSDLGEHDVQPVAGWFREPTQGADAAAVRLALGRVLDAGAGAGIHSLALQARGLEVCAIDFVPEAVDIMRARGVRDAQCGDLLAFTDPRGPYDTILVIANGSGLAETLDGLPRLFAAFDRLLAPGGQVLMDSSDLRTAGGSLARPDGRYLGEIEYWLEYRGEVGSRFRQLLVDPATLSERAERAGWRSEVAWRSDRGHYLARLRRGA